MTANGIFQLILYMVVLLALVKPLGTYMARVYECPTGLDRALVELIDLPPDDLFQRFKDGKVYIPGLAQEAVENFFRKGNLIALRELALQRTAQLGAVSPDSAFNTAVSFATNTNWQAMAAR